ncbi:DNA repair protein RadC [Catenovulum sp. SM1970]|uniref:RadC family protein n=1 Tax=Marinifaba aquimaris TaxID=2741323 RepID=UPI001571A667|nr:DNA repair protein RadC [Marinifaba aquimaris]NTS75705.1 DNA repair protein RadC [Marinifaba aquimaris]
MSILDWPAEQRPREKLLAKGADKLSDAELLAIFLRTGVKGCSAVELAQQLLCSFGGLNALLKADLNAFCQAKGLGSAKYAQLQACIEMTKRFLTEAITRGDLLDSSHACRDFLLLQIGNRRHEVFIGLFLDNQNRVIEYVELFQGTIDSAAVYPRVVVEYALKLGATSVILAHNHPSGIAEPSKADLLITDRLVKALALIDVRVLDHFIIADNQVISLAETGRL